MHAFKNRFGIPGVISVFALVFAMLGGAYAASNDSGNATASAKKTKKAKKGPRGPRGPQGPAGPAGPQGPAGETGAPGAKGAQGAQGEKGATGAEGAQGPAGAKGATGATGPTGAAGAAGAAGAIGPTGPEGSPWTAGGTLPSGQTETGYWSFGSRTTSGFEYIPISFPIPLTAKPKVVYVGVGQEKAGCSGSAAEPAADPGNLCVYEFEVTNTAKVTVSQPAPTVGATLIFGNAGTEEEQASAVGSFAVTAP
jgi:hypothetical protein